MSIADVKPSSSLNFACPSLLDRIANETGIDVKNEEVAYACLVPNRGICRSL